MKNEQLKNKKQEIIGKSNINNKNDKNDIDEKVEKISEEIWFCQHCDTMNTLPNYKCKSK